MFAEVLRGRLKTTEDQANFGRYLGTQAQNDLRSGNAEDKGNLIYEPLARAVIQILMC